MPMAKVKGVSHYHGCVTVRKKPRMIQIILEMPLDMIAEPKMLTFPVRFWRPVFFEHGVPLEFLCLQMYGRHS